MLFLLFLRESWSNFSPQDAISWGNHRTVGWNSMKSKHSIDRQKSLSHELQSEWASEQNKWAQRSAQTKRAVRSKRMSERCKWTSERRGEWPSTLRVDFIVILPTVRYVNALLHNIFNQSLDQWREVVEITWNAYAKAVFQTLILRLAHGTKIPPLDGNLESWQKWWRHCAERMMRWKPTTDATLCNVL